MPLLTQRHAGMQVGGVVKRDARNLAVFEEAGGYSKLAALLRWVEASFPAASSGKAAPLWPAAPGWSEATGGIPTGVRMPWEGAIRETNSGTQNLTLLLWATRRQNLGQRGPTHNHLSNLGGRSCYQCSFHHAKV